jgi:hypothetical protein
MKNKILVSLLAGTLAFGIFYSTLIPETASLIQIFGAAGISFIVAFFLTFRNWIKKEKNKE